MSMKFKNPIEVDGQVTAEYLDLSTSTTYSVNVGEIAWNSVDGTFDIGLLNGVTLQTGQEMYFYGKATEAISNGNAVMFAGVQGDHILIAKADAATINANPEYFMGVATQDFATNDFGYVTAFGNVRGIDTSTYTLGDILYYDSTTSTDGLLTPTMPSAPNAKIIVAAVVKVHATQGILAVRPHTMPKLKDIQDVNVDTATTGEILQLQSTGVWENKTLSEAGIVSGSGTTNYVPKFTSATTLGDSQIFDNGTSVLIGTSTPHLGNVKFLIYEPSTPTIVGYFQNNNAICYTGYHSSTTTLNSVRVGAQGNNLLFSVSTDGSPNERMRITSAGNVGIGTTTPSEKLEVFGKSNLNSVLIGNFDEVLLSDPKCAIFRTEGNPIGIRPSQAGSLVLQSRSSVDRDIVFVTGATPTERMTIKGTGNIGIGTTTPDTLLQISSLNSSILRLESTNTALGLDAVVGEIQFEANDASSTGTGVKAKIGAYSDVAAGNAVGLRFFTGDAGFATGTEKMRILAGGNVGIGTTSPGNKLQISAADSSNQLLRLGVSYDTSRNLRGGINWYDGSNTTGQISTEYNGTMVSMVFGSLYNSGYNSNQLMIIRGNGNVGIGTTSPSYRTQIETTSADVFLTKNTSSTSFNRSYFYNNNNVGIQFLNFGSAYGFGTEFGVGQNGSVIQSNTTSAFAVGTSGAYPLALGTSGTERMRITSTGNVGIGTSSPNALLDVEGDALINRITVGRGGGNVSTNTAIGRAVLDSNVNGGYNTVFGYSSLNALDRSGNTVVGCNMNLMPNGVDLIDSDNNLVVGQYNPDFSDSQVPHIYAPDKIFCPSGVGTNLLEIDYSLYTAAFLEYSIYNSAGDQFRAGRFVVAFKGTGTPDYADYPEVIFSGTTSNVVFDVPFGAGLPVIKLINNESDDFYIRFTSRLLMR